MKNKVELLAPAGNYEAFLGAVNAGADAVYLGGEKFGARAYADNFTTEEICHAIHTAHFMGIKIYLTVNTLVKDSEFNELYNWLLPFYEAGLDGVIVQDMGVLCFIREHFKGLALHASTQMTLTGAGGALFLKEQGVERIVPARELSLEELRRIKAQTGLEIECFIHGAMCYCYSGQCLFSSLLGGRSGNRGRCAQPCRLPFQICKDGKRIGDVEYPLSLKDMCTIAYIPKLIEAGIDSFKIEGRMKRPEYAAGVTALYRKYIDLYDKVGNAGYHVDDEDWEMLHGLYIRSEVQTGYYERHNGREMITLHKPSYMGSNKELLEQIKLLYLHEPDKLSVKMEITLKADEPSFLRITESQGVSVSVCGDIVQPAKKMPLQCDNIRKQMVKTGNTLIKITECDVSVQGDVFLPVSALNELRRKGVDAFERQYILAQGMTAERTGSIGNLPHISFDQFGQPHKEPLIDILVSTCDQLDVAVLHPCRRIYIDSDLYLMKFDQVMECIRSNGDKEYYLALPYVLRMRDKDYLKQLTEKLDTAIRGFLVRNLEEAAWIRDLEIPCEIVPDAGLYVYNTQGMCFWSKYCREYTLPYELNASEAGQLTAQAKQIGVYTALIIYGRIPMMVTANCIKKTAGQCSESGKVWIKDRYGTDFPVETNCIHCYNIIYNSVPYSLHMQDKEVRRTGADIWRYDFTVESAQDCRRILKDGDFPYEKYTTGHLKRGVE